MASEHSTDVSYTATHEWARMEESGMVTVGISDHAQDQLGDIVFVELPEVDINLTTGEEAGVVESVKAASDVYAPIAGRVCEVNEALADNPELINQDAFGEGWFYRLEPVDPEELSELMDAEAYGEMCDEED